MWGGLVIILCYIEIQIENCCRNEMRGIRCVKMSEIIKLSLISTFFVLISTINIQI